MTNEELKYRISVISPLATIDESSDFLTIVVDSSTLLPLMNQIRADVDLDFDYLFCMTGIDWKDHFMIVYHLTSKKFKHSIVIKAKINDIADPKIESVNHLWKTAELNEDEIYDLLGIQFLHHPNLRRLFLEEDWKGYPLRKNYVDENMIKL